MRLLYERVMLEESGWNLQLMLKQRKEKKENGSGEKETQQNCLLLLKLVTIYENVYLSLEVIF